MKAKKITTCPDCNRPLDSWIHLYYGWLLDGWKVTKAQAIVFEILEDLTDRRGLKNEWDNIDDDVQEEIISQWVELAMNPKLEKAKL